MNRLDLLAGGAAALASLPLIGASTVNAGGVNQLRAPQTKRPFRPVDPRLLPTVETPFTAETAAVMRASGIIAAREANYGKLYLASGRVIEPSCTRTLLAPHFFNPMTCDPACATNGNCDTGYVPGNGVSPPGGYPQIGEVTSKPYGGGYLTSGLWTGTYSSGGGYLAQNGIPQHGWGSTYQFAVTALANCGLKVATVVGVAGGAALWCIKNAPEVGAAVVLSAEQAWARYGSKVQWPTAFAAEFFMALASFMSVPVLLNMCVAIGIGAAAIGAIAAAWACLSTSS